MNPDFADIPPPPVERPKESAEHILWDERLSEPAPPKSLLSRIFDKVIFVGGIAGTLLAVGVVAYSIVSLFL